MRISDWSSDVCSSDLIGNNRAHADRARTGAQRIVDEVDRAGTAVILFALQADAHRRALQRVTAPLIDRQSVVSGKSVSVRVALCGRRIFKTKYTQQSINMLTHYQSTEPLNTTG